MLRMLSAVLLLGATPASDASWSPGAKAAISRLSAKANNLEVETVGGHNLLARWSCGAPCELAELLDPAGGKLNHLSFPEVSPDRAQALSFNLLDVVTGDADIELIDLRSGKSLVALRRQSAILVGGCAPRWEASAVVIPPCGARKSEIRIRRN